MSYFVQMSTGWGVMYVPFKRTLNRPANDDRERGHFIGLIKSFISFISTYNLMETSMIFNVPLLSKELAWGWHCCCERYMSDNSLC